MADSNLNPRPDLNSAGSLAESDGAFPQPSDAESLATWVWLAELASRNFGETVRFGNSPEVELPRMVGQFRLDTLLGTGGYGAVFRAFDTELECPVGLKLAWPSVMFDAAASRRFVDEPKTVAALNHPGIIRVYGSGWIGAVCYIALELVEGPALGEWFRDQERVSVRLAAEIVGDIAKAIQFAHERDIIHRDLKPSNILLRPHGTNGPFPYQLVVCDFGLARRPRLPAASAVTRTHEIIGTDPYIAPEQLAGGKTAPDPSCDIFSLGVILYELVTGRRPFDGETIEETRNLIKNLDPPAPRSLRTKVPRDLETIILKCLEKSPTRRYVSARELADDLQRFLNDEPIRARPPAPWQRSWKMVRRNPLASSLWALGLISALVIATLLGAWAADRKSAARQIAVADTAERQQRYASNIQHAAEALRRGGRREVLELLDECRSLANESIYCGVEWDFLWAQVNRADRTLKGHAGSVHCVRYSPNGDLLVSGGEDGRVIIWDASTGTKQHEIDDHVGEVNTVEISSDGSLVAIGGDDGRVVVHRMKNGSVLFDEPIVKGRVFVLAWLGNSMQLAVGGEGAVLSVVDLVSLQRRCTGPLPASPYGIARDPLHPIEIKSLTFIPERNWLAVSIAPAGLPIFDVSTLSEVKPSLGEFLGGNATCYVPSGPGYLAETCFSWVRIWNLESGSKVAELSAGHEARSLRYSAATKVLVASLRNGAVQTWNIEDILAGRHPGGQRFDAHDIRANSAEISPDGTWLATGGQDSCIRVWRRQSMMHPFDVPLDNKPWGIEFSPCGRWAAVVDGAVERPRRITICDANSGEFLWATGSQLMDDSDQQPSGIPLHSDVAFDPTGSEVACLEADFVVRGRDSRTGYIKWEHPLPANQKARLCGFSPDAKSLVIAEAGRGTFFLERGSGDAVHHIKDATRTLVQALRTTQGDFWLETGAVQKCLLGAASLARKSLNLPGLSERVQAATLSPDGRYLAAASADRIIYFWDLNHLGPPGKLVGHEGVISNLHFSADGATILSHAYDGTVRFWRLPTRTELLKLGSPDEPIHCMGLSPGGNLLVLGIEHEGHYGLQIHRLGADRESLAKSFELEPNKP